LLTILCLVNLTTNPLIAKEANLDQISRDIQRLKQEINTDGSQTSPTDSQIIDTQRKITAIAEAAKILEQVMNTLKSQSYPREDDLRIVELTGQALKLVDQLEHQNVLVRTFSAISLYDLFWEQERSKIEVLLKISTFTINNKAIDALIAVIKPNNEKSDFVPKIYEHDPTNRTIYLRLEHQAAIRIRHASNASAVFTTTLAISGRDPSTKIMMNLSTAAAVLRKETPDTPIPCQHLKAALDGISNS